MNKPEETSNESARLRELDAYNIETAAREDDFDFLTKMAAQICHTKISLISLITADKQLFLSNEGLKSSETCKEISFCAHAVNHPDKLFIVENAQEDERFKDNPLVTQEPFIRFYAGVPLVNENGYALGTLCVIDSEPKILGNEQKKLLSSLGNQAMKLLELRKKQIQASNINQELRKNLDLLEETQQANKIGGWELHIGTGKTIWTEFVYHIHEVSLDYEFDKKSAIEFYHPNDRAKISKAIEDTIATGNRFDVTCRLITAKNNEIWVRSTGRKVGDKLIGSFQDITEFKKNELKFRGIFNSTFTLIGFLDLDGTLLEANETALKVANLQPEDVIGKPFWDCYWWQISEETKEELKRNFYKAAKGEMVSYEVKVWTANKISTTILFRLKPIFDDHDNVVYVLPEGSPVQDIVDVRQRFKSVIEGTNVGTWEWNVQTGETIFNEKWAEILGYTLEELQPVSIKTWTGLAHPDDLIESNHLLKKCFQKRAEFYEFESRMKHRNGDWVWVMERGKVFEWTHDGKPLKMYGTLQDINQRKKYEEELRVSEEAFRGNFENAAIGMALLNEEGKWLKVNEKVCEILGYTAEELMQLTFQDITHPEDLDKDLNLLKEVIEGKRTNYNLEKRYFHKNGNIVHIILAVSVVRNHSGAILYFVSQIIDITAAKKHTQKLKYQQNLLNALYELSPIGIALNDFETGKFKDVNNKLIEPSGYTRKEFLNLSYWDLTPIEYETREKNALKHLEETGVYGPFQKEFKRKDGSRYPVLLRGVMVEDLNKNKFIWSFIQDISKEKEAEKKLQAALSNLQAILDASTQVIIIATNKKGLITHFNSGAETALGYKQEEVLGRLTPLSIHEKQEIRDEAKKIADSNRKFSDFEILTHEAHKEKSGAKEWTYIRKDGSKFTVLLSVTAIKKNDKITGYLGVAVDISELKRVETEIKSLLDITQDQNNRLKNFAHIVSHNLRSHSSGIIGLLDVLETDHPELKSNELFIMVSRGAENLQQTVEDLSDVISVSFNKANLHTVNLHDVIEKNIDSLSSQIRNAKINIENLVDLNAKIKGVPAYIESIVLNFITNAIKYRSPERNSYLKIYSTVKKDKTMLFFKDNGLGMDLKNHGDRLFKMYKTFHSHEDSRGLGLFIVKNQIESMNGKIEVESQENIGTTFKVILYNEKD
ncbi:PAS domain S-box protein [Salegentibacter sp. BLCTC]|uniref:PAS domain S-box protein n=1 Tax=Salegentibacter sp. BLCTC TaxID=2697368 RepID=UPI00187B1194|nr:PAS domain S-box protein [Salegentibacter sp. BLCTC]MBE7641697.1 PAS domain S-box protein [Salegentibacter sp. BLCTC]